MKRIQKIIASVSAVLSLLALGPTPAFAAAVARNLNITSSLATATANEAPTIVVDDDNLAFGVGWLVGTSADTGNNVVSGGGLIDTGPAGVLTDVDTGVNDSAVLGGVDVGGQTLAENDTITGSTVTANANKTALLVSDTMNVAGLVGAIVMGGANTGGNTAEDGLFGGSGGDIYTGAAGFGVLSDTTANTSSFDVLVDMSGNTTARNVDVTNSSADATATSDVAAVVTNTNFAFLVGNVVVGVANSGDNEADGGMGFDGGAGGLIDTDLSFFGADVSTTVNTNDTLVAADVGGTTLAENESIDPSTVDATADTSASVVVVNDNLAAVVGNVVMGGANTGDNTANGGDAIGGFGGTGGSIFTGVAGAGVFGETTANTNDTSVLGDVGGNTTARNQDVVDSTATATATGDATALIVNDNVALGGNLLFVAANSGGNEANGGDGDTGGDGGWVETGEAGVLVGSSIAMNDNTTMVAGDFGGNVTAENISIDPSTADATATGTTTATVLNLNDAEVVTEVEALANTGDNTANGGTNGGAGGTVVTGDALLLAEADTWVNTSQTFVVGDFTGNATARNTGVTNSDVDATATSTSGVLVVNDNSLDGADVTTSILAEANTGNNSADGDDDGGFVSTGGALLVSEALTEVNTSTTTVAGAGGGNATATNSVIDGSLATSTATSTGTTAVVNTNDAEVDTEVATVANTGGNTANGGSGATGGTVDTGAALNGTLVETAVNTNTTTVAVEQGDATASNTGVSGGSTTTATADSSTTTAVTNDNTANVTTVVETSSNTGGNTAVDGGMVTTGAAVTGTSGSTTTNTNTTTLVVTN